MLCGLRGQGAFPLENMYIGQIIGQMTGQRCQNLTMLTLLLKNVPIEKPLLLKKQQKKLQLSPYYVTAPLQSEIGLIRKVVSGERESIQPSTTLMQWKSDLMLQVVVGEGVD